MSGRRHHYLPRFLQRPFAHASKGKGSRVHAYHRTHGAFPTNVANVGHEVDFYGGPDDTTLDDRMTALETQLAATIQQVNAGEMPSQEELATLLASLTFRTKAMRTALSNMVPELIEATRDYILDQRRLRDGLLASLHDPAKRRQLLTQHLRKKNPKMDRNRLAKEITSAIPRWEQMVAAESPRMMAEAEAHARDLLDLAMAEAPALAETSYLNALSGDPLMPVRAQRLASDMTIDVWVAPEAQSVILGDCGPVGWFSDGTAGLAMDALDQSVSLDMILLPVSPRRVIVARKPDCTHAMEVATLNRASASASHEFFISHEANSPQMEELRAVIGTIAPLATRDEILALVMRD